MSLILDLGDGTSLNPINVFWKFGFVGVGNLDVIFNSSTSGFDEAKDGLVFGVCPVGELVVPEVEVNFVVGTVVVVYDPVPIHVSLEAHGKLLDVLVCLVETGGIVGEFKLVDNDGGGGRSEDGENE